jgi:hypothetical protein
MEGNSLQDVVKAISDSQLLEIFRTIALGNVESEVLKQSKGLSNKQYYLRIRRLLMMMRSVVILPCFSC